MKKYIMKHWGKLVLALVLIAVAMAMLSGLATFKAQLIDLIIDGEQSRFLSLLLYGVIFAVVMGVAFFTSAILGEKFGAAFSKDIRKDVYNGIMRRNRTDFEDTDSAEYISAMTNDMNIIEEMLVNGLMGAVAIFAAGLTALVIMLSFSPLLTVVSIGINLVGMIIPALFGKPMENRQKELSDKNAEFTVQLKEILKGRNIITSFRALLHFNSVFANRNNNLAASKYRVGVLLKGAEHFQQVLSSVVYFGMLLASGLLVINGTISIGTLVLFNALHGMSTGAFMGIFALIPAIRSVKPVFNKVNAFITYENIEFTGTDMPTFSNKVEVSNLGFKYNEDVPLIDDFSLTINKNEKLAVIGPSGCGKSTLTKLLSGDIANFEGQIMYDDNCIHQLDIGKLREKVTVIHQDSHLFNDTIRFNICLGETFTDEQMERALTLSGAIHFISDIPEGLEYQCGENGVNLSGGQKQRLSIARALIRDTKFLVLDEGTSAVDLETANEIERNLLEMPDLTLVSITHRVNDGSLEGYDRVIDMGKRKLELTHHNLSKKKVA